MRIYLAKTAGFCEGVQKAVNKTIELHSRKRPTTKIYTYGPLIHNPQTLAMLEKKGIGILHAPEDCNTGEVIIRTHGVPPSEHQRLKDSASKVHNATCSKVARVQAIIKRHVKQGRMVIIIGDKKHAEVKGLLGFGGEKGIVIENESEARELEGPDDPLVVCQTTFDLRKFEEIKAALISRFPLASVNNTICDSTHNRQGEVEALCGFIDAMVVVGGKGSANTGRLVSICADKGVKAFHIESPEEIDGLNLHSCGRVGVTAGASTPRWLINYILEKIESSDRGSFTGVVRKFAKTVVYSYLMLALAAAALSYVFTTYMELPRSFTFAAISFLYVYALFNINVYFFGKEKEGREREISKFSKEYRIWLAATTLVSLGGAVWLSHLAGPDSFIIVSGAILLGFLFHAELFSGLLLHKIGVKSLHDIPGSKDIFSTLALSTVIVLVPVYSGIHAGSWLQVVISFFITASLIFLRSILLHLVDIEEDRIVGRDTIATYLGERTTVKIATWTTSLFIIALFLLSILGIGWSGAFLFSLNTLVVLLLIRLFRRKVIMRYYLLSLAMDLNLILAGAVAFIGKMFIN